jgi:ELWxxDGT repeat protein
MGAPIDIGIISNQSIVTTGYSFTNSYELWHSDGTPQNTRMLKDINPGKDSSLPRILFTANKKAYFRATTRYAGRELWVTDGTESGTRMLMDCVQGSKSGFPTSVQGSGPIKTFSVYGPDSFYSDYRTVFGLDTRNDSIYSYSDLARNPQGLINYIYRNDSQVVLYYLNDSRPEMLVTNLDKTKVRYLTFPCNLSPKNTPKSILKISETEWAILEETDENQRETKNLWWYSENVPCEKEGRLIINPNPSSDELRVLFEYPLPPDATLRVYKFSGQLIREEPLTKGSPMGWRIYDIDDIKSGAYIIQVNSGSMNKTAKWIKI